MAYGNGVWVAVAQFGTNRVMRSTDDGVTWSAVAPAEVTGWISVAYGDGVWVAVAFNGTNRVMRSLDPSPDSGGGGSSAEPALAATGLSIAATVALVANAGALIAGGTLLVSRSRKMRAGR
jgi:hypothetical protein